MHYYYLIFLLFSLSGLLFADYRHKLFFFRLKRRAAVLMTVCLLFFLIWDSAGILLDVFSTNPAWVSGPYFFTPDMPMEEPLFLALFLYNTAIVWRLVCLRIS